MTMPINERKWNPPQACSAFRTAEVKKLFQAMAARFPGGVLAFDSCNKRGAKPAYTSFRALSGSGSHDSVTDKENAWIRTYLSYERKR